MFKTNSHRGSTEDLRYICEAFAVAATSSEVEAMTAGAVKVVYTSPRRGVLRELVYRITRPTEFYADNSAIYVRINFAADGSLVNSQYVDPVDGS